MPPKKRKGGKKKKKKTAGDGELTIEDKYKKTMQEIEALKDHLAVRKELARRSHTMSEDWKGKMDSAEESLLQYQEDQRAVSADMTRQYKTMQTEMGLRIHQLETELERSNKKLAQTEDVLKSVNQDKDRMEKEKDDRIKELEIKINSMGLAYENVLNDAMDNLITKIDDARRSWDDDATYLLAKNKQTLLELGLNPLEL